MGGRFANDLAFYVEASPAGGWRVMVRGEWRPVSRHDTEEEAFERMGAYARGLARQAAAEAAEAPATAQPM